MKLKTLRILSVLFLALFIATRMTASADSHNPYTTQAKIFDKKPSAKVVEAAKKLADEGDTQKAIVLYTLVCNRFKSDLPEKEKQL